MDLYDWSREAVRESHCNVLKFWQYVQKSSFVFTEVNNGRREQQFPTLHSNFTSMDCTH